MPLKESKIELKYKDYASPRSHNESFSIEICMFIQNSKTLVLPMGWERSLEKIEVQLWPIEGI